MAPGITQYCWHEKEKVTKHMNTKRPRKTMKAMATSAIAVVLIIAPVLFLVGTNTGIATACHYHEKWDNNKDGQKHYKPVSPTTAPSCTTVPVCKPTATSKPTCTPVPTSGPAATLTPTGTPAASSAPATAPLPSSFNYSELYPPADGVMYCEDSKATRFGYTEYTQEVFKTWVNQSLGIPIFPLASLYYLL